MNKNYLKYTTVYQNEKLDFNGTLELSSHLYLDYDRETTRKDIDELTSYSIGELTQLKEESKAIEKEMLEILQQHLAAWGQQAEKTMLISAALEYRMTPEIKHTNNQWEQQGDLNIISNKVYQMHYRIYERTKYDKDTRHFIPYEWHLTWDVYIRGIDNRLKEKIAGQDNKKFTDQQTMEKYLNGRIKAYNRLFTEISPAIPPEYAHYFKVNGKLLPGYTVKDGGNNA